MKDLILLSGGVLVLVGFVVSLICVAMVAGFTRSTHTVQYVPHDNTPAFEPEPDLLKENEDALLGKVGKKNKVEKPTVVEVLDAPIEEITKSDLNW